MPWKHSTLNRILVSLGETGEQVIEKNAYISMGNQNLHLFFSNIQLI